MIYCPNCGTANRDGSRFCNECASPLPTETGVRCPMCSTPNPPGNVFCDNCGARLVPAFIEEEPSEPEPSTPARKGLSLPTKQDAAEPAESAPEETPDWLSKLRSVSSDQSTEGSPASPTDRVPEWMRDASSEEQPEWLRRLAGYSAASDQSLVPTESSEPTQDQSASDEAEQPARDSAEISATPDWFNTLTGSPPSEEQEPESAEPLPGDEVPDWISRLGATQPPVSEPETSPAASEPQSPAPEEETPDWLKDLSRKSPTPETESAEDVPDWLKELESSASAVQEEQPSDYEEAPAWLQSSGEERPAVLGEEEERVEPSDIPDWLQELSSTTEARPQPGTSIVEEKAPTPEAGELEQPGVTEEIPEWLTSLRAAGAAAVPQEEAATPEPSALTPPQSIEPAAQPTDTAELPEWAKSLVQAAAKPERRGPSAPIPPELPLELREEEPTEAEMPTWLKALREEQGPITEPAQPILSQGEIPAWVEALRPTEEQPAEEAGEEAVEQEGVFAGLAQVLPPAPIMGEAHGEPAQLVVETSPQDLARAGIFQELLARAASVPKPVTILPSRAAKMRQRVLRWIIFALMLLAIWAPGKFDLNANLNAPVLPHLDQLLPDPMLTSANQQVEQLSSGSTVLVMFDYDPIQAGEMNPIAQVILRQLRSRSLNVKVAGLNPLGATLAQNIWNDLSAEGSSSTEFSNLGYIPGQSTGVQQLLLKSGPIDLAIDLAASSDSLRWWAEQLVVGNFDVPLIAGVSAGVEPLALPYTQSGQVKGLITGLAGAFTYANLAGLADSTNPQSVENQIHLEAQIVGHWLLIILIIIGLVYALVSPAGRRSSVS